MDNYQTLTEIEKLIKQLIFNAAWKSKFPSILDKQSIEEIKTLLGQLIDQQKVKP